MITKGPAISECDIADRDQCHIATAEHHFRDDISAMISANALEYKKANKSM
jgi:hypothetical protein